MGQLAIRWYARRLELCRWPGSRTLRRTTKPSWFVLWKCHCSQIGSGSSVYWNGGMSQYVNLVKSRTKTDRNKNNGSITSPASRACCVGFKPTVGLVSRTGAWPANTYQDSPGPMARCVEDAARVLQVIAGKSRVLKRCRTCY